MVMIHALLYCYILVGSKQLKTNTEMIQKGVLLKASYAIFGIFGLIFSFRLTLFVTTTQ
jgi:hypothetical protein